MQKQQGKAIALNPRGIWVLSQVVLPGKLGSWLAQAAQELTNPQVWITAPLPCVFSLRGKRLKIRTDTTLIKCMSQRSGNTTECYVCTQRKCVAIWVFQTYWCSRPISIMKHYGRIFNMSVKHFTLRCVRISISIEQTGLRQVC